MKHCNSEEKHFITVCLIKLKHMYYIFVHICGHHKYIQRNTLLISCWIFNIKLFILQWINSIVKNKCISQGGKGWGVRNWETGIDTYTLLTLCIK